MKELINELLILDYKKYKQRRLGIILFNVLLGILLLSLIVIRYFDGFENDIVINSIHIVVLLLIAITAFISMRTSKKYLDFPKNVDGKSENIQKFYKLYKTENDSNLYEYQNNIGPIVICSSFGVITLLFFGFILMKTMLLISILIFICALVLMIGTFIVYLNKYSIVEMKRTANFVIKHEELYIEICGEERISTEKYFKLKEKYKNKWEK